VIPPWLVALAFATSAAVARAEPSPEAVRLEYSAPPGCPLAESFVEQVSERTSRGRFAEPGELARTFSVTLSEDPPGFSGSLEFLDAAGARVSRRVHGERCDAVVSSLALITALSLDATLRRDDNAGAEPEPEPEPKPEAERSLPPSPEPRAHVPPRKPFVLPRLVPRRQLESARVGLLGGYGTALAAARLGLLAELGWSSRVALRLAAHYDWHEVSLDPERRAKLRQQGLELSLCPRRWHRAPFVVSPCVAVDLGTLRGRGVPSEGLPSVRAEVVWWSSLSLQLGVAYEPAFPFWIELGAALEAPLRAGYRFTFENPRKIAYTVPYLAGSAAIVSGVRFW
jgi:hypothetical protein